MWLYFITSTIYFGVISSSWANVCDVKPTATKSWYCCYFSYPVLGYFYSSYWLVCYWLLPIDGLHLVAWNWLMIIYNQLKIFSLFCFCCCFFTNPCYFFWRMAYRHLITFDFVYSMFFYNLLFTFICNCLWLVIYNPVLLIAIWPPSPSLSLWSPPRNGEWEWEYLVYVR